MPERRVTVRSLAKINLSLRVLHKRPDNYHELRTIFQTISLADTIHIRFARARRTRLTIEGNIEIPDNLIVRAAQVVLEAAGVGAEIAFTLEKNIPMGAGLGGGSSNAAAVLLAIPVLAGVEIPLERLAGIGAALGSDVPFFLYGGTAVGIGRGSELYPLADAPPYNGLLVAPGVHVSTAEAYRDLNRAALTTAPPNSDTDSFRTLAWALAGSFSGQDWTALCVNDFESAVFGRHPALESVKRKLKRCGARPALMTGSGSSIFGLFDSRDRLESAWTAFSTRNLADSRLFRISLVSQRRYRALWRRQLTEHTILEKQWPPRSRYYKK